MKPTSVALLAVLVALCLARVATADIVTDWNEAALDAIRFRVTPPPAAARNLAILHAAMFDAVNGIRGTYEPYLATGMVSPAASVDAAASTAAHHVLTALYPLDQDAFDALHLSVLLTIPDGLARTAGIDWGAGVAAQILDARADDGATATAPWPGSEEPGQWRPTLSFGGVIRPALLPLWGEVTPFALPRGSLFRPPPPPGLRTHQYAAEVNRVKKLGELHSRERTAEQTEIAQFWGYGPGTATPPGHWNQIAQVVAGDQANTLEENARLFALLNIALADAGIVSWDTKYTYNYWRPITAIQLADTDGNPHTVAEATWTPLLPTPPFPEYTSGHSTFSGAAATVLALFYRRDRVAFSVGSDDLPGVLRAYRSFSEAAEESGVSRIYGGIHFPSANVRGLLTGAATGFFVFTHVLQPAR